MLTVDHGCPELSFHFEKGETQVKECYEAHTEMCGYAEVN